MRGCGSPTGFKATCQRGLHFSVLWKGKIHCESRSVLLRLLGFLPPRNTSPFIQGPIQLSHVHRLTALLEHSRMSCAGALGFTPPSALMPGMHKAQQLTSPGIYWPSPSSALASQPSGGSVTSQACPLQVFNGFADIHFTFHISHRLKYTMQWLQCIQGVI